MAKRKAKEEVNKGGAPIGNQNALGNRGNSDYGFYISPQELQAKVDEYFEHIKGDLKEERETTNAKTGATQFIQIWNREPEPATVTGLALFLGFESRQSLTDYEEKVEFSYIVKKAKTKVENGYEKALHGNNPSGPIFALKNMGWADKSENINKNTNINHNSVEMTPEEMKAIADAFEREF